MIRLLLLFILGVVLTAVPGSRAEPAPASDDAAKTGSLIGNWSVEFANGVKEVCKVEDGGACSVVEPLRSSNGAITVQAGSLVFTFNDDRVERWTPVGKRFVVEHWYPGSRLPRVAPVLGIAEKTP